MRRGEETEQGKTEQVSEKEAQPANDLRLFATVQRDGWKGERARAHDALKDS